MGMSHHRWEGYELMVSRTGFTGDLGYELWIAPEGATLLWNRLMVAGHVRGIRPIGYQALDMARIEAGFILPDVDFTSRIDAPHFDSKGDLWVDLYLNRDLHWERRNVRAWIVERPFYLPARRRATPPVER